jgi:hypothetical protein
MSGKINRWVCSSAFALEFFCDCDLKDLFLIDFAIRSSSGRPSRQGGAFQVIGRGPIGIRRNVSVAITS